jgi:hypothetical protein
VRRLHLADEDNGYWLAYPESRRNVPKIRQRAGGR